MDEITPGFDLRVQNEIMKVLRECHVHSVDGKNTWYRISDLMMAIERLYGVEAASLIKDKFTTETIESEEFSEKIKHWILESYSSPNNQSPENTKELLTSEETYEAFTSPEEKIDHQSEYEELHQSLNNCRKEFYNRLLVISHMQEESFYQNSMVPYVDYSKEMNKLKCTLKSLYEDFRDHLDECPGPNLANCNLEEKIQKAVLKFNSDIMSWFKEKIEDLKDDKLTSFNIDNVHQKVIKVDASFLSDINDELNSMKESQKKYEENFEALSRKMKGLTDHLDALNFLIEKQTNLFKKVSESETTYIVKSVNRKSLQEEFIEADSQTCPRMSSSDAFDETEIIHNDTQVFTSTPKRRLNDHGSERTRNVENISSPKTGELHSETNLSENESSSESLLFEQIKKKLQTRETSFDVESSKFCQNPSTLNNVENETSPKPEQAVNQSCKIDSSEDIPSPMSLCGPQIVKKTVKNPVHKTVGAKSLRCRQNPSTLNKLKNVSVPKTDESVDDHLSSETDSSVDAEPLFTPKITKNRIQNPNNFGLKNLECHVNHSTLNIENISSLKADSDEKSETDSSMDVEPFTPKIMKKRIQNPNSFGLKSLKYREHFSAQNFLSPKADHDSHSSSENSGSGLFERIVQKKSQNLYNTTFVKSMKRRENLPNVENVRSSKNGKLINDFSWSESESCSSYHSLHFEPAQKNPRKLKHKKFSCGRLIKNLFYMSIITIVVLLCYWSTVLVFNSRDPNFRAILHSFLNFLEKLGLAERIERRGPLPH